jgi:hypothetical protein
MLKQDRSKKNRPPEGMALLTTAYNSLEAEILSSKLKAYGIPVYSKHRGMGAYLTLVLGNSFFGIDIFVDEDKLKEAQDILKSCDDVKDEDILSDPSFNDNDIEAENEEFIKKLDRRVFLMLIVFIATLALAIYFSLTQ